MGGGLPASMLKPQITPHGDTGPMSDLTASMLVFDTHTRILTDPVCWVLLLLFYYSLF